MSTGKIINSKLAVRDGRLACDCCGSGPDDPDPPWVCPDCPDWPGPGGPDPPSNPNGDPRCCTGQTICSATDDEPLYLGVRLTGSIKNTYTYGTGPNAGVERVYEADWNEVFTQQSSGSSCEIADSDSLTFSVPFWSRNGTSPRQRDITMRYSRLRWDRRRGFYGSLSDDGNDLPSGGSAGDTSSGIRLTASPLRAATDINGLDFAAFICRSDDEPGDIFPSIPPIPRPNLYTVQTGVGGVPIDEGVSGQTSPSGACLDKVIYEFDQTIENTNGNGDVDSIELRFRFYCFVAFLEPCSTELIV